MKGILRSSRISDGWRRRFLSQHPKLSLKSGDATGHVRMNAMSRESIAHYFDLLKRCLEENDLMHHPERIYNTDKTGIPFDPKPPKVVSRKGQKKIRYRCSGQKGQITVLACCSGTGQALPPFVIFDAKTLNIAWTRGEVPGMQYGLSSKDGRTKDSSLQWLA